MKFDKNYKIPDEIRIKDLQEELKELKEDKEVIYYKIADLCEYIEDNDYIEKEYILEQLADMQQYAK